MVSQAQAVVIFLVVTAGIGAAVYYAVDMKGLDPLGLFGEEASDAQESALARALVSALDSDRREGSMSRRAGSGEASGKEGEQSGATEGPGTEQGGGVLGELVTDRRKRQKAAKQHARETVAAVVEEMTQVREEESKRNTEVDEDDEPKGEGKEAKPP